MQEKHGLEQRAVRVSGIWRQNHWEAVILIFFKIFLDVDCGNVGRGAPSNLVKAAVKSVQKFEEEIYDREKAKALKMHKIYCKEVTFNKTRESKESNMINPNYKAVYLHPRLQKAL